MSRSFLKVLPLLAVSALFAACATTQPARDYTAFRASRPHSILIVPPVNDSNSVDATYSVLSQLTLPLAESGYYVMPVTLVDETFRENGLSNPAEIEMVPGAKLQQIFGADAALYIHVKKYGTTYVVLNSASVVTVSARLVDLRNGTLLWEGSASASSDEGRSNGGGGVVGLLVAAVVNQIVDSSTDACHRVAGVASARLLTAGTHEGILYGPRSPKYEKDQ